MPRWYKKKTSRSRNEEALRDAFQEVCSGKLSRREAAKKYNVPRSTLGDYLTRNKISGCGFRLRSHAGGQIFSTEMEKAFTEYLKSSGMFYGTSSQTVRRLAYEFATSNDISVPDKWNDFKCAGKEWFIGFMKRNQNLSVGETMSFTEFDAANDVVTLHLLGSDEGSSQGLSIVPVETNLVTSDSDHLFGDEASTSKLNDGANFVQFKQEADEPEITDDFFCSNGSKDDKAPRTSAPDTNFVLIPGGQNPEFPVDGASSANPNKRPRTLAARKAHRDQSANRSLLHSDGCTGSLGLDLGNGSDRGYGDYGDMISTMINDMELKQQILAKFYILKILDLGKKNMLTSSGVTL